MKRRTLEKIIGLTLVVGGATGILAGEGIERKYEIGIGGDFAILILYSVILTLSSLIIFDKRDIPV